MLTLILFVKLIAEIALTALIGQWVLGLMAGSQRDRNLVYQLFQQVSRPFVSAVRFVSPRFVLERHHPLVAFLLLAFVWLVATVAKVTVCLEIGVQVCR